MTTQHPRYHDANPITDADPAVRPARGNRSKIIAASVATVALGAATIGAARHTNHEKAVEAHDQNVAVLRNANAMYDGNIDVMQGTILLNKPDGSRGNDADRALTVPAGKQLLMIKPLLTKNKAGDTLAVYDTSKQLVKAGGAAVVDIPKAADHLAYLNVTKAQEQGDSTAYFEPDNGETDTATSIDFAPSQDDLNKGLYEQTASDLIVPGQFMTGVITEPSK